MRMTYDVNFKKNYVSCAIYKISGKLIQHQITLENKITKSTHTREALPVFFVAVYNLIRSSFIPRFRSFGIILNRAVQRERDEES